MGCEPDHLTGYATVDAGRGAFRHGMGTELPAERGKNLLAMMDAAAAGEFKALWAMGYDVLLTNANVAATRRAMSQLELVVIQDLFLTETAKEFGTVFLPACSSFEKDGTFMNAERRVQRVRKAMKPLGESLADWEPLCLVARAMGHSEGFAFDSAEAIGTRFGPCGLRVRASVIRVSMKRVCSGRARMSKAKGPPFCTGRHFPAGRVRRCGGLNGSRLKK